MISIIIPALNEPLLPALIDQIHRVLRRHSHEILVQSEKGLTFAVRCGVMRAKGDIIIVMDGDGSHKPQYITPMTDLIKHGYDVVFGSRRIFGGRSEDSPVRKILSSIFCWIARFFLGVNIRDNMSGFVAMKRGVFEKYVRYYYGYKFGLQIGYYGKPHLRIVELPVTFASRCEGKSHTNFKQGIMTLALISKMRLDGNKST